MMSTRALRALDTFLHRSLDWYITRTLPGWGRLQVWQWHVCNALEQRYDMPAIPPPNLSTTEGES